MKKNCLFFVSAFLILASVYSQPCLPDGITFTTQTQIDSFATNNPNCSEIEGDVLIGDWNGSDITNLNGLSVLTSIEGSLSIGSWDGMGGPYNPLLTSLAGLDNLESIGGSLEVGRNLADQSDRIG
jgi:hypothetical protein